MSSSYASVLRRPGAGAFVTAGFLGRLPISMVPLGIVLLITATGGNYAVAGALSATYALSAAAIGPLGARWIDRRGQAQVIPLLLMGQIAGLIAFVVAASRDVHGLWLALPLILAGGSAPNIGSLVRARWAAMLSGDPGLRAAFAIEGLVDEMVFIVGPPLVTTVALTFSENAALLMCIALFASGGLWLASQRRTQPVIRLPEAGAEHPRFVSGAFLLVTVSLASMGAVFGSFEVTTVAFTRELGHEELTGVVLALYAVGSLSAGLAYGARAIQWPAAKQYVVGAIVLVVVCAPLPFVTSLGLLTVAAFLAGVAVSPLLILNVSMVEHLVPPARLTEAFTLGTSGLAVGLAVGSPLSGVLIDNFGAAAGYLVMVGSAAVTMILAVAGYPTLRRRLAQA